MKIACIAVPHPDERCGTTIAPPLALGYLAAVLEQRRHIVRIYDLALADGPGAAQPRESPADEWARVALEAFRPHLVLVATSHDPAASAVLRLLPDGAASAVRVASELREHTPAETSALPLWCLEGGPAQCSDESVIAAALRALDSDLDSLPFPARHLLPLERYPLYTPSGELQTPVLLAQRTSGGELRLRAPQQVVAEVQSIMREHGIRHFVFPHAPIAQHPDWLRDLLGYLTCASLGPCWELHMPPQHLAPDWLPPLRRAGCEMVCFDLPASLVLGARRAAFAQQVRQVQRAGLRVRAQIALDARPSQVPALIDVLATFNLDAVRLQVQRNRAQARPPYDANVAAVAELARTRYRSRRGRQLCVDRFGPQLGPVLWRVGLLGPVPPGLASVAETSVLVS